MLRFAWIPWISAGTVRNVTSVTLGTVCGLQGFP
ncbi:hypothetical protein SAMN05216499_12971 [Actinacidiphila paucisporea]|uniref:Uncharacterized protein n=1 Tax=Actinacidiphila paucisporea TaxID=310782 RepID=A0A1M7Q6F2_9ACTN|nr:hypothetical protein SAMN05216499_12971 [Actinacidiphila paucisporea]